MKRKVRRALKVEKEKGRFADLLLVVVLRVAFGAVFFDHFVADFLAHFVLVLVVLLVFVVLRAHLRVDLRVEGLVAVQVVDVVPGRLPKLLVGVWRLVERFAAGFLDQVVLVLVVLRDHFFVVGLRFHLLAVVRRALVTRGVRRVALVVRVWRVVRVRFGMASFLASAGVHSDAAFRRSSAQARDHALTEVPAVPRQSGNV